jgi:hypothetical protein
MAAAAAARARAPTAHAATPTSSPPLLTTPTLHPPTTTTTKSSQYDARRRASPDPEIKALLAESVQQTGILAKVFGGAPPKLSPQEIIEFIFFPVVNEVRCCVLCAVLCVVCV